MDTTDLIIIVSALAIISLLNLWWIAKCAKETDETPTTPAPIKFEPRKISYTSSDGSQEKPKRPYKRRKKKKPAVANNETTEKKPVGRPRKNQ